MKASAIVGSVILLVAVGAAGFGFGVAHEARVSANTITEAKNQGTKADGDAKAARAALADVQLILKAREGDLKRARDIAKLALDQRDLAQQELAETTQQRTDALRKAARENRDCIDLARMPICPAVAERLFGSTGDPPGGGRGSSGARVPGTGPHVDAADP